MQNCVPPRRSFVCLLPSRGLRRLSPYLGAEPIPALHGPDEARAKPLLPPPRMQIPWPDKRSQFPIMTEPPLAGTANDFARCHSHCMLPLNACWFPAICPDRTSSCRTRLFLRIAFPRLVSLRVRTFSSGIGGSIRQRGTCPLQDAGRRSPRPHGEAGGPPVQCFRLSGTGGALIATGS